MAEQIIWSAHAKRDLKEILAYWVVRNKSKTYSRKLYFIFRKAVEEIAQFPKSGKKTLG